MIVIQYEDDIYPHYVKTIFSKIPITIPRGPGLFFAGFSLGKEVKFDNLT